MGSDHSKPSRTTGPVAYVVLLGGFALMLMISKPFLASMEGSSRNAECLTNLEFIATALEDVPARQCGPWPKEMPHETPKAWADAPACWDGLAFERDLQLWGQYEVRPSGAGWVATCRQDLDGDGNAVVYEATDQRTAGHKAGTED